MDCLKATRTFRSAVLPRKTSKRWSRIIAVVLFIACGLMIKAAATSLTSSEGKIIYFLFCFRYNPPANYTRKNILVSPARFLFEIDKCLPVAPSLHQIFRISTEAIEILSQGYLQKSWL